MFFVWVLESEGLDFEQSAAVALIGKYNVRLFHDPLTLVQEYSLLKKQSKFDDQHLVYFNSFKNEIFDAGKILNEINPKLVLMQDLSSQDLIRLSVDEIFATSAAKMNHQDQDRYENVTSAPNESFKYKDLHLNLIRLECFFEDEESAQNLSPKEAFILAYLIKHAGFEVDRTDLSKAVWGDVRVSHRTLDSHISRLRTKLNSSGRVMIEAVYGGGYVLR